MKMNMNKITSTSMSNPLIIIVGLLLILIIVLSIFRSASPLLNLGFEVSAHIGDLRTSFEIEAFSNDDAPAFVLFYTNWCGHCKRCKPEFKRLMEEYKGNTKVIMIDCEAPENKELVQSQNIKGFPTIRLFKNGMGDDYEEYTGGRTYSDFAEYLGGITGTLDKSPDQAAPFM